MGQSRQAGIRKTTTGANPISKTGRIDGAGGATGGKAIAPTIGASRGSRTGSVGKMGSIQNGSQPSISNILRPNLKISDTSG